MKLSAGFWSIKVTFKTQYKKISLFNWFSMSEVFETIFHAKLIKVPCYQSIIMPIKA